MPALIVQNPLPPAGAYSQGVATNGLNVGVTFRAKNAVGPITVRCEVSHNNAFWYFFHDYAFMGAEGPYFNDPTAQDAGARTYMVAPFKYVRFKFEPYLGDTGVTIDAHITFA